MGRSGDGKRNILLGWPYACFSVKLLLIAVCDWCIEWPVEKNCVRISAI